MRCGPGHRWSGSTPERAGSLRTVITDDELGRAGSALHDRFGTEAADAFGRTLPALVADLARRWGLRLEGLYEPGATSVVLAVRDGAGRASVLKVSPDVTFLARQTRMLRTLAPTGRAPEVIAASDEEGAVLLERVTPGDTLGSRRASTPPPQAWAALLSDLHALPVDGVQDRLVDRCEEMVERIGRRQARPQVRQHVNDATWEAAVRECRALLHTPAREVVLHGDLHLGNVLHDDRRGLAVIDPKLCVGDPCFDLVDYVVADGGPEQMRARAAALAPLVDLPTEHVLRWSRVNAVVTAVSRTAWAGPDERTRTLLQFAA